MTPEGTAEVAELDDAEVVPEEPVSVPLEDPDVKLPEKSDVVLEVAADPKVVIEEGEETGVVELSVEELAVARPVDVVR